MDGAQHEITSLRFFRNKCKEIMGEQGAVLSPTPIISRKQRLLSRDRGAQSKKWLLVHSGIADSFSDEVT